MLAGQPDGSNREFGGRASVGTVSGSILHGPAGVKSQRTLEAKIKVHESLIERFGKIKSNKKDPQVWKDGLVAMKLNLKRSVSFTTGANYQYWWSKFENFCADSLRTLMPFTSVTVAAFLSALAESSAGLGGVDSARSALRFYWGIKFPGRVSPTDSQEVRVVCLGIKRRFQKPTIKREPLLVCDFIKILHSTTDGGKFSQVRLCMLRLAAQVSVMFSTISRFEEAAALKIVQVREEDGGFAIDFLKGKQYQHGEARLGMMPGQPHLPVDPVVVLRAYVARLLDCGAGRDSWLFPAFTVRGGRCFVQDRPASYNSVLKQFKDVCVTVGVSGDPARYGLHSMRRGAATAAVNKGCSDHVVRKQMRASLETVQRYASLDKAKLCEAPNALFSL